MLFTAFLLIKYQRKEDSLTETLSIAFYFNPGFLFQFKISKTCAL